MVQETETGHFERTGRLVLLAFVALFVAPPIVLQPVRPVLVDIVPQPTLWQSVALLLGQVLLFVLAVRWWTLRQRFADLDAAQPDMGVLLDDRRVPASLASSNPCAREGTAAVCPRASAGAGPYAR